MPPQRTIPSKPSKKSQTQPILSRTINQPQRSLLDNAVEPDSPPRPLTKFERFEAHQQRLKAYDDTIRDTMARNNDPEKVGRLTAWMRLMIKEYYEEEGEIERNEMRAKREKPRKELKDQKAIQERGGKDLERRGDGGIEHLEQVIVRVSGVAGRK